MVDKCILYQSSIRCDEHLCLIRIQEKKKKKKNVVKSRFLSSRLTFLNILHFGRLRNVQGKGRKGGKRKIFSSSFDILCLHFIQTFVFVYTWLHNGRTQSVALVSLLEEEEEEINRPYVCVCVRIGSFLLFTLNSRRH